jgi:hypothetical protein
MFGESGASANAKALLDEAKRTQTERRVAAKQKELDRLGEDLRKGKDEMDELQKSIYKVGNAVTESTSQLEKLGGQKKQHTEELELANLRIEAEKLKSEGLKLLSAAHSKAVEAISKRNEELDLKTTLVSAEIRQISGTKTAKAESSGKKGDDSKSAPTVTELRRQLEKAERASALAAYRAREAMDTASQKLQQAEAAAAKAEKRQGEIALERSPGFPGGNDPLKVEKPGKK